MIGTGHLVRTGRLLDQLVGLGYQVQVVCPTSTRKLITELWAFPFEAVTFNANIQTTSDDYNTWLRRSREEEVAHIRKIICESNPKLLIVDHYGYDDDLLRGVTSSGMKILVFDDLGFNLRYCNYRYDTTLPNGPKSEITCLAGQPTTISGPAYALIGRLNDEASTSGGMGGDEFVNTWLLYFGSNVGIPHLDKLALKILSLWPKDRIKCVYHSTDATFQVPVREDGLNISSVNYVASLADYSKNIDYCIGAAGSAHLERLALKIPTLLFKTADNQTRFIESIKRNQLAIYGGTLKEMFHYFDREGRHLKNRLRKIEGKLSNINIDDSGPKRLAMFISSELELMK